MKIVTDTMIPDKLVGKYVSTTPDRYRKNYISVDKLLYEQHDLVRILDLATLEEFYNKVLLPNVFVSVNTVVVSSGINISKNKALYNYFKNNYPDVLKLRDAFGKELIVGDLVLYNYAIYDGRNYSVCRVVGSTARLAEIVFIDDVNSEVSKVTPTSLVKYKELP